MGCKATIGDDEERLVLERDASGNYGKVGLARQEWGIGSVMECDSHWFVNRTFNACHFCDRWERCLRILFLQFESNKKLGT